MTETEKEFLDHAIALLTSIELAIQRSLALIEEERGKNLKSEEYRSCVPQTAEDTEIFLQRFTPIMGFAVNILRALAKGGFGEKQE